MPSKLKQKTLTGVAIITFILIPILTTYAATTTQYTYDDLNRLIKVEYGDGTVIEYYYDKLGNRIQKAILVADIAVNPTSNDFGLISAGSTSASTRFTITSAGTADLVISTITTTGTNGSEFAIQNDTCSGQAIAPSSSCIVDVAFSPTSGGAKNANLTIPSNDSDTPTLNIPLKDMLEELEKAHVYIAKLNELIKEQQKAISTLSEEVNILRKQLELNVASK